MDSVTYSGYSDLPPKLEKFLYKNYERDPECEDTPRGSYMITPVKDGLDISGGGWRYICVDSFFVPYEKLYPFLTPAGKKAVDSILSRK